MLENVSNVRVSQNDDDRVGGSIVNDDVGEDAGSEDDEMAFGDNNDPDTEDVPPDDLLLDWEVADNLLWHVDDGEERHPSNGECDSIVC